MHVPDVLYTHGSVAFQKTVVFMCIIAFFTLAGNALFLMAM
jgi:hypothetical protein